MLAVCGACPAFKKLSGHIRAPLSSGWLGRALSYRFGPLMGIRQAHVTLKTPTYIPTDKSSSREPVAWEHGKSGGLP